jgi:glycosyltransferase involved in cell wall biosynthesis
MTMEDGAPRRAPKGPAVLFVSYPAGLGGSARSLLTLLAGLEGRCERVVARRPATTVASQIAERSLADAVVDLSPRTRGRAGRVLDAVRLARWARRHRERLVAVHANGLSELKAAVVAARVGRARLVVWVHEPQIPPGARRTAKLLRSLVPAIDWVTVSEASRAALEQSGVPGDGAVAVTPNPISVTDLGGSAGTIRAAPASGPADPVTVTYVGAPAAYKGFPLLPDVIESVSARSPNVRWHVWSGPRSSEPEVWERLSGIGAPVVELHDKTVDVADAYLAADIVFCPSLEESFGRVAAEAMTFGRPVVASDLPALREVLGDTGTFFPRGDHEAAARVIGELVADADRRRRLGAAGAARADRFAPDAVTSAFARRYGLGDGRALVVTHEATRTGAPVVAAQVAAVLRDHGWRVDVVRRAPGPLDERFRTHADEVHVEGARVVRVALRHLARRTHRASLTTAANRFDERLAARLLDRLPADLVWCNTVLSGNYLRPAVDRGLAVVLHGHELGRLVPGALRRFGLSEGDPPLVSAIALAAASAESQEALAEALGIGLDRVHLLESTVDVAGIERAASRSGATGAGEAAGDPTVSLVIGACGHATERKGTDLWLTVAEQVHRARPETRFVWVGRDGDRYASTDAARALGEAVRFAGESEQPLREIAAFDIFTLPSRYDTFPLVVLEAMALGRPVVAFDAGGAGRQLGEAGVLVEAGDVDAFSQAVLDLIDDPARRAELGAAARARVLEHFDLSSFGPRVRHVVEEARGRRRRPRDDLLPREVVE